MFNDMRWIRTNRSILRRLFCYHLNLSCVLLLLFSFLKFFLDVSIILQSRLFSRTWKKLSNNNNFLLQLQMLENVNIPLFLTVQHYCLQLFNTNFGINFALYCISGQNFRKAVRSMLCRRRLRRNETAAFTGT